MTVLARPARIGLVHTVAGLEPVFEELIAQALGRDVEVLATVDEELLHDAIGRGGSRPETAEKLRAHVAGLVARGAQVVIVTCSSMGQVVELIAPEFGVPVLRVDAEMIDQALEHGSRIGVLATLSTTLEPTTALLRSSAARLRADATITAEICAGAYDAMQSQGPAAHDEIVGAHIKTMAEKVDVIVLAQASMARAAGTVSTHIPVLSSPRLAVDRLSRLVAATTSPS